MVYRERGDNSRIRLRGPDETRVIRAAGLTFVHNLLSVTGDFTPQPFVDDSVVCVFNGEIYNQPYRRSDGEVLIPLYRRHGVEFARHIDGEFAIALYDLRESIAIFVTDPFRSKPLFVNGIECASYRSAVGGEPARPNEILVRRLDGTTLERVALHRWQLEQWKEHYDDWIAAFENAVRKRAVPGCYIGLSSGYDSGALACSLGHLGIDFKAYTFASGEHEGILNDRLSRASSERLTPRSGMLEWLRRNVDNEPYSIFYDGQPMPMTILDDRATLGVATMAQRASAEGRKVCLSGQGADEILSDYSLWPEQSELKGTFPSDLKLWTNFSHGCQESYLLKEEYAAGAFGIENRYPYLDTQLVQEFLWLSSEAKNRHYKAPLREYLLRKDYPFEEGVKRGFTIQSTDQ